MTIRVKFFIQEESDSKAGDIDCGGIIARAIPTAIFANEPSAPVSYLGGVRGGKGIGVGMAAGAGMGSVTRLLESEGDTSEFRFIFENSGDGGADSGVITPIAPAGIGRAPATYGFEGREPFTGDGMTTKGFSEEK